MTPGMSTTARTRETPSAPLQVLVLPVDAGVEDGDAHARAVQARDGRPMRPLDRCVAVDPAPPSWRAATPRGSARCPARRCVRRWPARRPPASWPTARAPTGSCRSPSRRGRGCPGAARRVSASVLLALISTLTCSTPFEVLGPGDARRAAGWSGQRRTQVGRDLGRRRALRLSGAAEQRRRECRQRGRAGQAAQQRAAREEGPGGCEQGHVRPRRKKPGWRGS